MFLKYPIKSHESLRHIFCEIKSSVKAQSMQLGLVQSGDMQLIQECTLRCRNAGVLVKFLEL